MNKLLWVAAASLSWASAAFAGGITNSASPIFHPAASNLPALAAVRIVAPSASRATLPGLQASGLALAGLERTQPRDAVKGSMSAQPADQCNNDYCPPPPPEDALTYDTHEWLGLMQNWGWYMSGYRAAFIADGAIYYYNRDIAGRPITDVILTGPLSFFVLDTYYQVIQHSLWIEGPPAPRTDFDVSPFVMWAEEVGSYSVAASLLIGQQAVFTATDTVVGTQALLACAGEPGCSLASAAMDYEQQRQEKLKELLGTVQDELNGVGNLVGAAPLPK